MQGSRPARRRGATRIALGITAALASATAGAGAFIFAEQFPESVSHPEGYDGDGGVVSLRVCILPGFQNGSMRIPVQNIVDRLRLQVAVQPNLLLGNGNDIPGNRIDFESVALHELGHCVGLAHPNAASESGLDDPQANATKALPGSNDVLDVAAGSDGLFGSPDDARNDDENLHWFEIGVNDPFREPAVVDGSTYSRDLDALPSGDAFPSNADRDVGEQVYGVDGTEAVMQQGTFFDEAQRYLSADDVTTLRFAQAGVDRVADTGDDYTIELVYGGISSSPNCDITFTFDTSSAFAFCSVSGVGVGATDVALRDAQAVFSPSAEWHFSNVRIPFPAPDIAVVRPGQATSLVNDGDDSLLANDVHPDGRSLSVTAGRTFAGPSAGTVSIAADGTFTYDHTGSGEGTDSFVYEVCVPGEDTCSHQRVTVRISATANNPPRANADALVVAEGRTATVLATGEDSVLANDVDVNGDDLEADATPASPPMNGSVTIAADGTFEYVHDGSETTMDAFTYRVCDDQRPELCAIGTVSITVTEVNDPMTAVDDELAALDEDEGAVRIRASTLLANDDPGPGESAQRLFIDAVDNPVGGTVERSGADVLFTPAPDYFGPGGFDYVARDNGTTDGAAAPSTDGATATFDIRPVNDVPVLADDELDPVAEDDPAFSIDAATLFANDVPGPENEADQVLSLQAVSNAVGGTVVRDGQAAVFTPAVDFNGEASFRYTAIDDGRTGNANSFESASATVRFSITSVIDDPRPRGDAVSLFPGSTATVLAGGEGSLLANDVSPEATPLVAALVDDPASGTVTVEPDGTFSYVHSDGPPGFDSFSYEACDATDEARCASATVTVATLDPSLAACTASGSRAVVGAPFLVTTASGFPAGTAGFEAANLPAGLGIDPDSGVISGLAAPEAAQVAPYDVVVTSPTAPGVQLALEIRVDADRDAVHLDGFEAPCAALPAASP